jgi:YidC/Oxa1 family membrane protein insertase
MLQIWTAWLESLRTILEILSSNVGLGSGLAIVVLTLILRFALLPVSWRFAYSACIHQKRLKNLQPEIQRIRERFRDEPQYLGQATMELYRKNGLRLLETGPILGALVQMPVLLGLFSVLRQGWEQARFLWVANLSRPDFYLAVIAGATTALMILANPDLPEHTRMFMLLLPSIIAFVFALKFASALALYWIASNCFTAAQTWAVHHLVGRRIQSGVIKL